MTNPLLTVTRFLIKEKRAVVNLHYTANVYAPAGKPSMGTVLLDMIKNMRDQKVKGYLTFTEYKRNHKKEDVISCPAIMLEYPYKQRTELLARLDEMPYAYYLIDTVSEFTMDGEARILVAFPLAEPITEPKQYTRVASLLWDEIGLVAHTKGCISVTFLFVPYIANPGVRFFDHNKDILDATEYAQSRKRDWVVATDGAAIKPKPRLISDDGLFDWGAA